MFFKYIIPSVFVNEFDFIRRSKIVPILNSERAIIKLTTVGDRYPVHFKSDINKIDSMLTANTRLQE